METYNYKNKIWEKEKSVTTEDIENIIGKGIPFSIDGLGNIEIDKVLSPEEKLNIEKL